MSNIKRRCLMRRLRGMALNMRADLTITDQYLTLIKG